MSLFEDKSYQWRETYFVLFQERDRPQAVTVVEGLRELGSHYEIKNIKSNEQGQLLSLTIYSPQDYSAIDINSLTGEEVIEHAVELASQMIENADEEERKVIGQFTECDARFDVYHFEQKTGPAPSDDADEILDPGSLLIVLDHLAQHCKGIGVDPQSGALMEG